METRRTDAALIARAVALAGAHSAEGMHGPFGAVIARGANIVSEGCNSVVIDCDPTAHAEIVAIRRACAALGTHTLAGCSIYCSCEPCPLCLSAIYWARLERVVYAATRADAAAIGFDDAFIYDEIALPAAKRSVPSTQLSRRAALVAMKKWKRNPLRQRY